jgi:diguanylate cyclase (GGDEF)-like protein
MKTIFSVLDKRRSGFISGLFVLVLLSIASAAFATGNIFYFEPFFIFPVIFASWYGSSRAGIFLAVISSLTLVADRRWISGASLDLAPMIYDGVSHLFVFTIVAIIITNFRKVHRHEVIAADTDNLTGLLNPRGFYAKFDSELQRSARYKRIFSLAYIDIDNFKKINDTFGHSSGDNLLVEVANSLKSSMRATDVIARLGGDEFVCLLPETNEEDAKVAFAQATDTLEKCMDKHNWAVSFSIGIVTFGKLPNDIKAALKVADELMYSVKNNKKDSVAYRTWRGNI